MKLNPYLLFNGNSEEALNTYQKIFNGKIEMLSRFGEQAFGEAYKDKIMHARLVWDDNIIMISDGMPDTPIKSGDNVDLCLGFTDEQQTHSIFEQLAEGGNIKMPLEKQFWGALYGQVTDKFGINWMLNCEL